MSKRRKQKSFLSLLALFFMSLGGFSEPAFATKPVPPFVYAQEAMFQGKLGEAARWYSITHKDFPKSHEGRQALAHHALLLAGKEISQAKLASLYREAATYQKIEGTRAEKYIELSQAFEKKGREVLMELRGMISELEKTDWKGVLLTVKVNPDKVASPRSLEDLRRGEWVDSVDRDEIRKSVYLRTYLGLLGTVCQQEASAPIYQLSNAPLNSQALFHSIGSRLLIVGENFKDSETLADAKRAFETVIRETEDRPYDKLRRSSMDFLRRIQKLEKKGMRK